MSGNHQRLQTLSPKHRLTWSRSLAAAGICGVVVCSLFAELLRSKGDSLWDGYSFIAELRGVVLATAVNRNAAAALLGALVVCHFIFLWANRHRKPYATSVGYLGLSVREWLKLLLVILAVNQYSREADSVADIVEQNSFRLGIDQSSNCLVFVLGIVFSQYVSCFLGSVDRNSPLSTNRLARTFFLLLLVTNLFPSPGVHVFKYHDQLRETGIWVNPNTFGLLMAVGFAVSLSWAVSEVFGCLLLGDRGSSSGGVSPRSDRAGGCNRINLCLGLGGLAVFGVGLVSSYSRGAWLATLISFVLTYGPTLLRHLGRTRTIIHFRGISVCVVSRTNFISIAVIVVLVCSLLFIIGPESLLTKRIQSVANTYDLSWRNRLTAWDGALGMIMDHPFLGSGWINMVERFEQLYSSTRLAEGLSIILNDYLTLGIGLGIPAILIFGWLVGFSFAPRSCPLSPSQSALLVLLTGFAFDGGLFKLALAVPFWMLLELAACDTGSSSISAGILKENSYASLINASLASCLAILFLGWSLNRQELRRTEFCVAMPDGTVRKGLSIIPPSASPVGVVTLLLHPRQRVLSVGSELRQFAELGLVAVAIEQQWNSLASFESEIGAISKYIGQHSWGSAKATAWVGSFGAAGMGLRLLLNRVDFEPTIFVGRYSQDLPVVYKNVQRLKPRILFIERESKSSLEGSPLIGQLRNLGTDVRICSPQPIPSGDADITHATNRLIAEACLSAMHADRLGAARAKLDGDCSRLWVLAFAITLMVAAFIFKDAVVELVSSKAQYLTLLTRSWMMVTVLTVGALPICFVLNSPWFDALPSKRGVSDLPQEIRQPLREVPSESQSHEAASAASLRRLRISCYNRGLVNWRVTDEDFASYVLPQEIGENGKISEISRDLLWMNCYPRVRKSPDTRSAAEIIVLFLRQRITIVEHSPGFQSATVSWQSGSADKAGFDAIYLASLRSVGIPCKRDAHGWVRILETSGWSIAPAPLELR